MRALYCARRLRVGVVQVETVRRTGSAETIGNVLAIVDTTFEQTDGTAGLIIGANIRANQLFLPPTRLIIFATADNELVSQSYFAF